MSAPIEYCWVSKAARGDEDAYFMLIGAILYNLTQPAHSIFGCRCTPSCPEPTEEQKKALDARIQKDISDYRKRTNI